LSNIGRQVVPLFVDFQIPPAAAAAKNVFDGDGMPTTSETRPIVFAGPTFRQRKPAIVVESSSKGFAGVAGVCAATLDVITNVATTMRAMGEDRDESMNPRVVGASKRGTETR
jgi:hypothetical protein